MLKRIYYLITGVTLITPAFAADNFNIQLLATSDYVVQGISQTLGESSLQAGASYHHHSGAFTGVWLAENSLITRYTDQSKLLEADYYVGYAWLDQLEHSWTLLLTHYSYPNSDDQFSEYRYNELSLSTEIISGLSATFGVNHNLYDRNQYSRYFELVYEQAVRAHTILNTGIGYNDIDALDYQYGTHYRNYQNYRYWHLGASQFIGRFMLDLSYINAQNIASNQFGADAADARWVFSITTGF